MLMKDLFARLPGWAQSLCAGLLLFGWIPLVVQTESYVPSHALVIYDIASDTYIAPPCISDDEDIRFRVDIGAPTPELPVLTYKEAVERGGKSSELCIETGSWFMTNRSLMGKLLERIGWLSPMPSRWNDDGSWNW